MCVGIPGQIVGIYNEHQQLVDVDISGIRCSANVACVIEDGEQIQDLLGDWVLVHVGFAMSRIDEQEAQETLQLLRELGELQQELQKAEQKAGAGTTPENPGLVGAEERQESGPPSNTPETSGVLP